MAQCFLHGNGGANPLNFKVVGNPQPTNPKENTIWVNTDTPITGWHLGAEEPGIDYLTFPYSSGEHLFTNGITFTANADKSITVNGIAQGGRADYVCYIGTFKPGKYKLSGLTEINGADGISVWNNDDSTSLAYLTTYGTYEFEVTTEFYGNVTLLIQEGSSHSNTIVRPKLLYCSVGMAWITTGTLSTVAFNALKKNGIQVYPISAKQYINNAWVDKEAKIYQNGAWVNLYEWNGQLYELGEEFISKTGGWDIVNGRNSSYDAGQGTKEATEIHLACGTVGTAIAAVTVNKVDLSKYTTLKCNVTNYKRFGRIQVASSQATDGDGVAFADITGEGTYSLNIANLTGSYYILICTWYSNNSSPTSLHFDKVWLE